MKKLPITTPIGVVEKIVVDHNLLTQSLTSDQKKSIQKKLDEIGVVELQHFAVLDKSDFVDLFSDVEEIKKVAIRTFQKELVKISQTAKADALEINFPKPTKGLPDVSKMQILLPNTQNTKINPDTLRAYMLLSVFRTLNIEVAIEKLWTLCQVRMTEMSEEADRNMLKVYKQISKFKSIDTNIAAAIDIDLSLLANREKVMQEVDMKFGDSVVIIFRDILQLRSTAADIESFMLAKNTGTQFLKSNEKVSGITRNSFMAAVEDFAGSLTKMFSGLNGATIRGTLKEYIRFLELIQKDEVIKMLGVSDKEDLHRKIGINTTAKDQRSIEQYQYFIDLIIGLLDEENEQYLNDDIAIVKYLQQVWEIAQNIEWFNVLSNSQKAKIKSENCKGNCETNTNFSEVSLVE